MEHFDYHRQNIMRGSSNNFLLAQVVQSRVTQSTKSDYNGEATKRTLLKKKTTVHPPEWPPTAKQISPINRIKLYTN